MTDADEVIRDRLERVMNAADPVSAHEAIGRSREWQMSSATDGNPRRRPALVMVRPGRVPHGRAIRRTIASAFVLVAVLAVVIVTVVGPQQAPRPAQGPIKVKVLGAGFAQASNVVVASGQDIFVCCNGYQNMLEDTTAGAVVRTYPELVPLAVSGSVLVAAGTHSLTEISVPTGRVIRVISGTRYQLTSPNYGAISGNDLFLDNFQHRSIIEVDLRTGALVRVISGRRYGFQLMASMVVAGHDLVVANETTLTEVDVRNGMLVRVIPRINPYGGDGTMAVRGSDVFLNSSATNDILELDATSGTVVRRLPPFHISGHATVPNCLALIGRYLYADAYANVGVYNTVTGRLVRQTSAPLVKPATIVVAGGMLFVWDMDHLVEIDPATGSVVRTLYGSAYDFESPTAAAVAGDRVFVANNGESWITEMNATTGAFEGLLSSPSFHLASYALAVHGVDLFSANYYSTCAGSVTEIDARTGTLVHVISGPKYQLVCPDAMVVAGNDLFVADDSTDKVTEIDARTGALVRVIAVPTLGKSDIPVIEVSGDYLFAASQFAGGSSHLPSTSVTEVRISTGKVVRVLSGPKYGISGPDALTVIGAHLLVANSSSTANSNDPGRSVTEIDTSSGALVRIISRPAYGLDDPAAMAVADNGDLLVVSVGSGEYGTLTEVDPTTGALVRRISGRSSGLNGPFGIAVAGEHIFVTDTGVDATTEISW